MANAARVAEKTRQFIPYVAVKLRNLRQAVGVRELALARDIAFIGIALGIGSCAYASNISNAKSKH